MISTKTDIIDGPIDDLTAEDLLPKNVKVRVSMYLDMDIVLYFKDLASKEGEKYQPLINRALRDIVHGTTIDGLPEKALDKIIEIAKAAALEAVAEERLRLKTSVPAIELAKTEKRLQGKKTFIKSPAKAARKRYAR